MTSLGPLRGSIFTMADMSSESAAPFVGSRIAPARGFTADFDPISARARAAPACTRQSLWPSARISRLSISGPRPDSATAASRADLSGHLARRLNSASTGSVGVSGRGASTGCTGGFSGLEGRVSCGASGAPAGGGENTGLPGRLGGAVGTCASAGITRRAMIGRSKRRVSMRRASLEERVDRRGADVLRIGGRPVNPRNTRSAGGSERSEDRLPRQGGVSEAKCASPRPQGFSKPAGVRSMSARKSKRV